VPGPGREPDEHRVGNPGDDLPAQLDLGLRPVGRRGPDPSPVPEDSGPQQPGRCLGVPPAPVGLGTAGLHLEPRLVCGEDAQPADRGRPQRVDSPAQQTVQV
jgi:hypothetical protein